MTFGEYKELSKRTLADLGSLVLNTVHCSLGISSETYELIEASSNKDKVNVGEELGDKLFYLANYINVNSLNLSLEFNTSKKPVMVYGDNDDSGATMVVFESMLQDYDKKLLAYGKERDVKLMEDAVSNLFISYNNLILSEGLDASQIMTRNITKLMVRFPTKFTQEDANHRDLVKEREVLEGK